MAERESFCSNEAVLLTDLSAACPQAWEWAFEPSTVTYVNGTNATSQHPEVTFDQDGVYSVSLTVTNDNGDSTLTKENYLYAGGRPLPFLEGFEPESMSINDWTVINPDEETAWEIIETGGNEPGTYSMSINFHDTYSVFEIDQLISPVINLKDAEYAALTLKHAYAQYQSNLSDSLNIYASNDCGETWTKLYAIADDGTGNFATIPATTNPFIPGSEDDWCSSGSNAECIVIDVSAWAGAGNFQVMFESIDLNGNALYIDDVELVVTTSAQGHFAEKEMTIDLYPVPAEDYIYLSIHHIRDYVDVELMDMQGAVLFSQRYNEERSKVRAGIPITGLGSGVYFIRFSNAEFSKTEKVIVK